MAATLVLKRNIGTTAQQQRDAFNSLNYVAHTTLDSANILVGQAPVGRPAIGTAYSMEAWLTLRVTNAPSNNITNIFFWGNPSQAAAGIMMHVGTAVASATPTMNKSTKATHRTTAYPNNSRTLLWSNKTLVNVGDCSHFLILQAQCTAAAGVGTFNTNNMVWHYSYLES